MDLTFTTEARGKQRSRLIGPVSRFVVAVNSNSRIGYDSGFEFNEESTYIGSRIMALNWDVRGIDDKTLEITYDSIPNPLKNIKVNADSREEELDKTLTIYHLYLSHPNLKP
jgi:hypothetical protein